MSTLTFEAFTALAFGHVVGATADAPAVSERVVLELDEGELDDEF